MDEKELFKDVKFPYTILAYGKGRNQITTYNRSEYPAYFNFQYCENFGEATNFLKFFRSRYFGPDTEITIYCTTGEIAELF